MKRRKPMPIPQHEFERCSESVGLSSDRVNLPEKSGIFYMISTLEATDSDLRPDSQISLKSKKVHREAGWECPAQNSAASFPSHGPAWSV
jgi:hypothetical protein